ncbi:hypothetical protein TI39_contig412g00045 [Zymoseptoria brevis]|uniref:TM7S3/TM198-like domain-containing protein n=1 Tax=Zymoseptoria brevis TaxID=1047168 RepID=A0A0F4GM30_9PEZI|nr:hypothetical protein TI39_contig412g00045 [Zymoseptoria brevis]
MRFHHALVALLVSLTCAERIAGPHRLYVRQASNDDASSVSERPTGSSTNDGERSTITQSASRTASDQDSTTSTASDDEKATSSASISRTKIPTATGDPSPMPAAINGTTGPELPIQPRITPGLGVAGALLIMSGVVLGFVGIKHRATQTFLSTALVTALGVVVLIIYLMNPPVTDAIEGAFLIAAVLGGCLLGGLALIFKEVSEGLGCILGGFSLAMWLLVLAPGGTIHNQVGRIVLICMLCAVGFCLYISRFTRVYGIIGCTAFAGATAFILGVDCYSKAGLKEFWIYIWNVNDDVFPLFTNTYPITKNMRAETAGIVILAFFGTMSQIKIWKIVKETKAKRDAERTAYEEARETEEAELGRDIEEQVKHDRAEWEGTYGAGNPIHLSKTQTTSTAVSVDGYGEGVSEVDLTSDIRFGEKDRSFALMNMFPDGTQQEVKRMPSGTSLSVVTGRNKASAASSMAESDLGVQEGQGNAMQAPSPPGGLRSRSHESLAILQSASQCPADSQPTPAQPKIVGLSTRSLAAREVLEGNDEPELPIDEDLASSVAATAAEAPDADALSVVMSRPGSMFIPYPESASPIQAPEEMPEEEDEEALYLGVKDPQDGAKPRKLSTGSKSPSPSQRDLKVIAPGGAEQTDLKDKLPVRMSKAAMNYRTNEWAKQISHAEPEPIEEVEDHTLDAVQIEIGNAVEAARAEANNAAPAPPPPPPASVQIAPKRVSVAIPPTVTEKYRCESTKNPYRQSARISSAPSNAALVQPSRDSEDSWSAPLAKRMSSNPLAYAASTSPVEERSASQLGKKSPRRSSTRQSNTISPMPSSSNLLDERRERMESRLTTTSFMIPTIDENPKAATPSSSRRSSTHDKASLSDGTKPSTKTSIAEVDETLPDDDEDMTLSQRKVLIQQQQQALQAQLRYHHNQPPLLNRAQSQQHHHPQTAHPLLRAQSQQHHHQSSRPYPAPITPQTFNAHPRRRASTHDINKAAQNWSQWRQSTQQDTSASNLHNQSLQHSASQIEVLKRQREQVEFEKEVKRREAAEEQARRDVMMRMGGSLHDKHRAAMARMQGKVDVK